MLEFEVAWDGFVQPKNAIWLFYLFLDDGFSIRWQCFANIIILVGILVYEHSKIIDESDRSIIGLITYRGGKTGN